MNIRLMVSCFQALRLNKEDEKFELMKQSLNGNYEPALNQLEESIRIRSEQALKKRKIRSLLTLDKQSRSKIQSYFTHWKFVEIGAQSKIRNNLK